jgi:tetratricopeptide (TPR) repeat protein
MLMKTPFRIFLLLLLSAHLVGNKVYALTREEIINIIRQLESAGFYEEAEKYKRLLQGQLEEEPYKRHTPSYRLNGEDTDNTLQENDITTDEDMEDTLQGDTEETVNQGENKLQDTTQKGEVIQDQTIAKKLTIWKYIQENPAKAIEILEKEEKTPEVLKQLGIAYYNLGDYIQAIKYLKAYTKTAEFESDRDKYKILLLLAYAYKNIFDDNTFKKYIQYVYEHKPDLLKPQDKLVLAFIYLSKDELDKVRDLINSFSDKDFQNLPKKDLLNLYALYYVKLGYKYLCAKNYRKALEYAYKAERYKPDLKALTELKAWIYLNMGEYAKALRLFKKILTYKKDPNIYYGIALCYAKLGNKPKAIRYLHLAENGADRLLYYKIARLYYDLGEKRQALRIIKLLREGRVGLKLSSAYSCNKEAVFSATGGNEELREIPNLSLPETKQPDILGAPDNNMETGGDNDLFGTPSGSKKKDFLF